MIRDKLNKTLEKFADINLESDAAREALVNEILEIVGEEKPNWLEQSRPERIHPAGQNYTIGHPENTNG